MDGSVELYFGPQPSAGANSNLVLTKIGEQPVSFIAGVRYWAESPDSGPDGFGFGGVMTFLFPK
ncbi:hypothetical protein [Mesorhizobium escarrei]|uniref:hypothetical protein n=1 Tax=Mesorhizobium escarrei TaxID=666018 RepID=UPI003F533C4A